MGRRRLGAAVVRRDRARTGDDQQFDLDADRDRILRELGLS